jgi:hypothetical protein
VSRNVLDQEKRDFGDGLSYAELMSNSNNELASFKSVGMNHSE